MVQKGARVTSSYALPFVARPRLWTWRLTPEIVILLFIAIYLFGTGPKGSGTYGVIGFLAAVAIGLPVWLWSRTLTASLDGVRYRSFFFVSRYAPYSSVRAVEVEQRVTYAYGARRVSYLLRITNARNQRISVAMDAYRVADLRVIAQALVAHAPKARRTNLLKHLIKGDYDFAR